MRIREATPLDAAGLLYLLEKLDRETDYMLFEPGERQTTLSQQETILDSFANDPHSLFLVAESDRIQGFCVVNCSKQLRNRHVASLVIGVQESSWSRGVGSSLMEHALAKAAEKGIKRIELTVRSDNLPAISLYKKFGFVTEGERVGSLYVSGELKNEHYMATILQQGKQSPPFQAQQ